MTGKAIDSRHHLANPVWRCAAIAVAVMGGSVVIWALANLLPGIGRELVFAPETALVARLIVAGSIVFLGLPFLLLTVFLLALVLNTLRQIPLTLGWNSRSPV